MTEPAESLIARLEAWRPYAQTGTLIDDTIALLRAARAENERLTKLAEERMAICNELGATAAILRAENDRLTKALAVSNGMAEAADGGRLDLRDEVATLRTQVHAAREWSETALRAPTWSHCLSAVHSLLAALPAQPPTTKKGGDPNSAGNGTHTNQPPSSQAGEAQPTDKKTRNGSRRVSNDRARATPALPALRRK